MASPRVAVIGAGMAGVSAVHHLCKNGIKDVTLFEAKDRIGGRVYTVTHKGKPLELGAQWIHGSCPGNTLFNIANTFGLLGDKVKRLEDDEDDEEYHWNSKGEVIPEAATKKAAKIFDKVISDLDDHYERVSMESKSAQNKRTSIRDFIEDRVAQALKQLTKERKHDKHFISNVDTVLSGMTNMLKSYVCDELDQCCVELYGSSIELPGGDGVVPGGVGKILDRMMEECGEAKVKLGHRVDQIDWTNKEIVVKTNKEEETFDYVICTFPVGVLKQKHVQLFHPALNPDKITSIENIGSGQVGKVFLEWDRPFWAKGEGEINLAWTREEMKEVKLPAEWFKGIASFWEVEGQPTLLLCWVTGNSAAIVDRVEDKEIIQVTTRILRQFTGDPGLSPPDRVLRHSWTSDTDVLGAYSYPSMSARPDDFSILSAPLPNESDPRLLFAGEATSPDFWSFMHGARMTGLREANRIIEMTRK